MSPIRGILSLLILLSTSATAVAATFPGPPLNAEYAEQQAAADEAYEAENFTAAYAIYMNDLAPKGDKFAQHQIGLMLVEGIGTELNPILGAAWLDLGSERGAENMRKIRNEVWKQLSADQKSSARDELEMLEATYGDCAIIARLAEEDQRSIDALTGTRVTTNDMLPVTMIYGVKTSEALGNDTVTQRRDLKLRKEFMRDHCRF